MWNPDTIVRNEYSTILFQNHPSTRFLADNTGNGCKESIVPPAAPINPHTSMTNLLSALFRAVSCSDPVFLFWWNNHPLVDIRTYCHRSSIVLSYFWCIIKPRAWIILLTWNFNTWYFNTLKSLWILWTESPHPWGSESPHPWGWEGEGGLDPLKNVLGMIGEPFNVWNATLLHLLGWQRTF